MQPGLVALLDRWLAEAPSLTDFDAATLRSAETAIERLKLRNLSAGPSDELLASLTDFNDLGA